ncbi:hypothetical protein YC2023_076156 [Brassica napus]
MSSSRIDKQTLFEQARKNICSSRYNDLLLKIFSDCFIWEVFPTKRIHMKSCMQHIIVTAQVIDCHKPVIKHRVFLLIISCRGLFPEAVKVSKFCFHDSCSILNKVKYADNLPSKLIM